LETGCMETVSGNPKDRLARWVADPKIKDGYDSQCDRWGV